MALNPALTYPSQINTTDPTGYPYGRAKNVSSIGDGTGTPYEEALVSDLFGMQQALLVTAGITPSNIPDKVGVSQYLQAIQYVSRREQHKAIALCWPERVALHHATDSTLPNLDIGMAFAPGLGVNGGGRFVLVNPEATSGYNPWSSDDATQWTFAGHVSAAHSCVAYGLVGGVPGFLMTWAGSGGHYTSTAGLAWGSVFSTVPAHGIAAYSSTLALWIIAGDLGQLYTSPTATAGSWTARTTPAGWQAGCGGVKRAVFANGKFVILPLASYNKCLTSSDGITWAERTLPGTLTWTGLAWSDHDQLWMAGSSFTPAATSPDGLTWTAVGAPTWAGSNDLACLGPLWVSVSGGGYYGGISWSADRGVTWQRVAVGNHRVATGGWNRILAADNRFLVAHTDGTQVELALSLRSPL